MPSFSLKSPEKDYTGQWNLRRRPALRSKSREKQDPWQGGKIRKRCFTQPKEECSENQRGPTIHWDAMGRVDLPIVRGVCVCAVTASSMTDATEGLQALCSEVVFSILEDPFQIWSFLKMKE